MAPLLIDGIPGEASEDLLEGLVQLLVQARATAISSLPELIDLFEKQNVGLSLRTSAAEAIVMVGGLEVSMNVFGIGDVAEVETDKILAVIAGLARSAPHTVAPELHKEAFFTDSPSWVREEVQRIALEALEHPSVPVRELALLFLQPAFGDEIAVSNGTDWAVNPIVLDAVQKVAQEDPDLVMRQRAEELATHRLALHVERIKQSHTEPGEE